MCPDAVFLQELGACPEADSHSVQVRDFRLGSEDYKLHFCSPPESHRGQAVLVRSSLEFQANLKQVLPAGILMHGTCGTQHAWPPPRICFACLHLPHSKRQGTPENPTGAAEEVWKHTLEALDESLGVLTDQDTLILAGDLNQDYHAQEDSFAGMGLLRTLIQKFGLQAHRSVGPTWGARGLQSEIDAIFVRVPRIRLRAYARPDMKQALPSDHSPVFCHLACPPGLRHRGKRPSTRCGRWLPDVGRIQEFAEGDSPFSQEALVQVCLSSRRVPSLRYKDSDDLKAKIATRRQSRDAAVRAAMLQEIRAQRASDRTSHQLQILERARAGDRQAISYLRKSAAHASFETSYIEFRGGQGAATEELKHFYEVKYSSFLPPPTPEAIQGMIRTHASVQPEPFTQEELASAIGRCKSNTSAGMDGVGYEAIKAYFRQDTQGKLLSYFNQLLYRRIDIPASWREAKVVLLPKVPSPEGPSDLRPICLSPCLSKIFSRLVMVRVAARAPDYSSGQMGCRPKTQTVDGILAAQTVIAVLRRKHQVDAHVVKLDIKAAFDSLSHAAVVNFLASCKACPEASLLWDLCSSNQLHMSLGTAEWKVRVSHARNTPRKCVFSGSVCKDPGLSFAWPAG